MSAVYLVITEDRHCDVEVEAFAQSGHAIEHAREIAKGACRFPEDFSEEELTPEMYGDGWIYYAKYSCEDDSVRVVRREIQRSEGL